MENTPRSSFIPKQASGAKVNVKRRKNRVNLFSLLATVILVGTVVLASGTFFYKDYITSRLEQQKNALAAERDRFNESDIASVRELDRRIKAAEYRLDRHLAASRIFDALELNTKRSVQFQSFALERRPSGDLTLLMNGVTREFKTVALQAEQLAGDDIFSASFFGGIANAIQEAEGTPGAGTESVSFSVTVDVPFSSAVYQESGAAPVETVEQPSASDVAGSPTEGSAGLPGAENTEDPQ